MTFAKDFTYRLYIGSILLMSAIFNTLVILLCGKGRIIWGVSYGDTKLCSHNVEKSAKKIVLMSSAENQDIINNFKDKEWEVQSFPGAGHKLLKVALGEASAYIVSKGTTFRWDTCGPHAIISALGGNIINFNDNSPLKYNDERNLDTQEYCNKNGIIAFTNKEVFEEIQSIIKGDM